MSKSNKARIGKTKDLEFNYVLKVDPELEPWRALAATWFDGQINGRAIKRLALDKFLCLFLPQLGEYKALELFFLRGSAIPPLQDFLQGIQRRGVVKLNNHVHDFLGWVLDNSLAIEDDNGYRLVPAEFHNPIPRQKTTGMVLSESVRTPLPYRYVKELRDILCQGDHFSGRCQGRCRFFMPHHL